MIPFARIFLLSAFLFTLGLTTQAQAQPKEIDDLESLPNLDNRKIVSGHIYSYFLMTDKKEISKNSLHLVNLTSNYEAKWFTKYEAELPLVDQIDKEFIDWVKKERPGRIILEAIEQDGKEVFKIIAYSDRSLAFPPTETLFPELSKIDLIDFDLEENQKKAEKMKLVAGGLDFEANIEILKGNSPKNIPLHYPTFNHGEFAGEGFYMTDIKMAEPVDPIVILWMREHYARSLVFEKVGDKGYKLVGYSKEGFLFLR